MKFILGKKVEMTQVWVEDKVVPVTRVQAGPCVVVQVKTDEKDGYNAVKIGYGERKAKNIKKPQKGEFKNLPNFMHLRESRYVDKSDKEELENIKRGDIINVGTFEVGDSIKVSSVSKGKGFQGVVKRHGFHGQDATHGNKDQLRMPGSAGATGPARVFKGKKMPGRMGGETVTVSNLKIIKVDKGNNSLLLKGSIPGARNSLVLISGKGKLVVETKKLEAKEEKTEKPKKVEDKKGQAEIKAEEKTENKKD